MCAIVAGGGALALGLLSLHCGPDIEPQVQASSSSLTQQTIPSTQYIGRWSNASAAGAGYLSLGMSGGGPDEVFWSNASVNFRGGNLLCTGTFIGPNLLLSAGHCGHCGFGTNLPACGFAARIYREGSDWANDITISGPCETLVQNNQLGDTHLAFCDDVPWGGASVPPGELLGMADFDLSPRSKTDPVWTTWQNNHCPGAPDPETCVGTAQMVFSPGTIAELQSGAGGGGVYGAGAFVSNQTLAAGSSGGAMWRQTAGSLHRIVSGGFSAGYCDAGTAGCQGSVVAQLSEALRVSTPVLNGDGVNISKLTAEGLIGGSTTWTDADYKGLMDSDQNGYFDVQERLDDIEGITARNTYWLGFESPRRNRMWTLNPTANVNFIDTSLQATINFVGAPATTLMELPKIALQSGGQYRMSIMIYTEAAASGQELAIELVDTNGAIRHVDIDTPITSGFTMFTSGIKAMFTTQQRLRIVSNKGQFKGILAALTLIRKQTANSFDTFDERMNWRNNTTGARAWILPYGKRPSSGELSWAGLVNDTTPGPIEWSLRNRQLAIKPNSHYRLCFDTRVYPSTAGSTFGQVQLGDGAAAPPGGGPVTPNALFLDKPFPVTGTWTKLCFPEPGSPDPAISTPTSDNLLQFGFAGGANTGQAGYLIDNVWFEEL